MKHIINTYSTFCTIFLVFGFTIFTSSQVKVQTVVQVRKSPYDKWETADVKNFSALAVSTEGSPKFSEVRPLDDPKNIHHTIKPFKTYAYKYSNPRWKYHSDYSHFTNSYMFTRYLPPLYANRYRQYPLDQGGSIIPQSTLYKPPLKYTPRCRSCGRAILQDSFCSDDFVIRMYIFSILHRGIGFTEYKVYVFDVYKDAKGYFEPSRYKRITYSCDGFRKGPELGNVYLVTGLYKNGVPNVDSCSWREPWNRVTNQQKRYVRKRYNQFCQTCKIHRVLRIDPNQHNRKDTCYVAFSPNPNEVTCRDRFSLCRYRPQTRSCSFKQKELFYICEQRLSN